MKNENNQRLSYILCINDRMFSYESSRTDPPKKGDNFSIFNITFVCKNKSNKDFEGGAPVIGEMDATRHSPVQKAIDILLMNSAMELSVEERDEIYNKYAPGLKTVPAILSE